jgi:glycosyltransferase involved in cell wall biosynthesis
VFDKKGGGAGRARNIGMQHADGKWLLFADADDFFTEDFYNIINQYKDLQTEIILFKANSVDSDSCIQSDRHLKLNKYIDDALNHKVNEKTAVLSLPVPWAKMVRRDYVADNNILFDETLSANDMMFVAKATCWAEKVKVVDQVLYVVTTRSGSLTQETKTNEANFLCRMNKYIDWNIFLKDYPYKELRLPIIIYILRARKISFKTFLKAFALAFKRKAVFSAFGNYMRIVKRHFFK